MTFTNKAAQEICERLKAAPEINELKKFPLAATFHAFGLSLLKEWCSPGHPLQSEIGRVFPFTLADDDDKKEILHRIPGFPKKLTQRIILRLSRLKQHIGAPQSEIEFPGLSLPEMALGYDTLLKDANAFDLDDLIFIPSAIFDRYPRLLAGYRKKYPWLLVDEYQDINPVQFRLITHLMPAESAPELFVIGDPDQSIYGFRGSDIRFILGFTEHYPGSAEYRLKTSYRCPGAVLEASGNVIRGGRGDASEQNPPNAREGLKIKITRFPSDKSEAEYIARTIEAMLGGVGHFSIDSDISDGESVEGADGFSGFAVLCRLRSQMVVLEKAFRDHAIPYQVMGDVPFYRREPAKTTLEVLKYLVRPGNAVMGARLKKNKFLKRSLLGNPLEFIGGRVTAATSASEALELIIATLFPTVTLEEGGLLQRLKQFAEDCGEFAGNGATGGENFLHALTMGQSADTYSPQLESVAIMTLHAAKGLEFNYVFIPGCEDGVLPCSLYPGSPCDQAEERRLLYVGMTRARRGLWLSYSDLRTLSGRSRRASRSPFLDHINTFLLEPGATTEIRKKSPESTQRSLFGL